VSDIIQAAKWMLEGKRVRPVLRSHSRNIALSESQTIRGDKNKLIVDAESGYPVWMTVDSLLEEWEIAP
jgi:hypothetical protein